MNVDPRLVAIDTCLYRVSVKAVIVSDGKLLLVKEEEDEWRSFPGGGIDYGESVDQALIRELSEELGIAPDKIKTTGQVAFVATGGILNGVPKLNLFYCVDVSPTDIKPTKYVQDHKWCSFEELSELYISPSTGNVMEWLRHILRGEQA